MSQKNDPQIGPRALSELKEYLIAHKTDVTHFCRERSIHRDTVYSWARKGQMPSAWYLRMFFELGMDVEYILTGRRRRKDCRSFWKPNAFGYPQCQHCGKTIDFKTPYCPFCGYRMEGTVYVQIDK